MKTKNFLTFALLLLSSSVWAQFPSPYCGPLTFPANEEPITLVNFAGINNTSAAAVGGPGHQDFTAVVGAVTAGQSYPITIKGNTDGPFTNPISVFFDWNQNNSFTDLGETFYLGTITNSTGADTIVLTGNIVVPAYAAGGTIRMRVVKIWDNNDSTYLPTPCNSNLPDYGEAEDYSITVTAVPQCLTGTQFPTTTFTPSLCDGSPTVISSSSNAGQYFQVNVLNGETYHFASSIATDYFTISINNGVSADFAGVSPISWLSNVNGTIRVYLHTNSSCGTSTTNRTTSIRCGTACLNGTLFPAATYTPSVCDSVTANLVVSNALPGQYSNVQVQRGSEYVFSTSVAGDYITLSFDGITAEHAGVSPLYWRANGTAPVRFYVHTNNSCGVDAVQRSKFVRCKILEKPGCVSNLIPAHDDTIYVSVGVYTFSWDMPTGGGPIEFMNFYLGLDTFSAIIDAPLFVNNIQIGVDNTDIGNTYWWWVSLTNAAGESSCHSPKNKFLVLASPPATSVETMLTARVKAYPNPVTDQLTLENMEGINRIQLLSISGQVLFETKINALPGYSLDMSAFSPGMYFIRLTSTAKTEKIIKITKN